MRGREFSVEYFECGEEVRGKEKKCERERLISGREGDTIQLSLTLVFSSTDAI